MSTHDFEREKARLEQEVSVQRQIAFASGIFQGDVTIRTLLESLVEGVVIIDKSGIILLVNTRAEQMFGYPREQLIGQPHSMLIPERFRTVHEKYQSDYFEEPKTRPMGTVPDFAGLHQDGSEFPVEISLNFIDSINGVLVLAFINDLTLREEYESAIQRSEELSRILGVMDYAIFILDVEGNVRSWNAGAERLSGYRNEEITGRHFSCFYTEEDRAGSKPSDRLQTAAADGRAEHEGWMTRKDGSRFWGDVIITAIRDEKGKLRGFSNVTRDITERKQTEDALRYSEARYRALFRDNPAMIVTLDAAWTILSVNPTCASQLGYTIEELEGQPTLKVFYEDDRPAVAEQLRICLQNPGQVHRWQFRKVRRDGAMLWVEEVAQVIHDLTGVPNILVVCQDITERKRTEEEREQLLTQLDAVLENINEGVVIFDLSGNILRMNQAALVIHDYERIEQVRSQQHLYQETFELSDLDGCQVPFDQWPVSRALRGERFVDYEVRVLRRNTGKSWICSYSGAPVKTRSGDTILTVNTMRDITERKRGEEALGRRTSELEAIFRAFPDIYFWVNAEERIIDYKTGNMADLYAPPEVFLGKRMQDVLPPDVGERMHAAFQQIATTGTPAALEYWLLGGEKKAFEARLLPLPGNHVLFVVRNITPRKWAEEEIERLNADLAARAAELEAANEEMEAFNYTVAHDLRGPLNNTGLFFQTIGELCGEKIDTVCKEYLVKGFKSIQSMSQLIDVLLEFSKLSRVEPRRENVDLSAAVREIADELKLTDPDRRCIFRITDGIKVNGDPKLLKVTLTNLLNNSWKYSGKKEEAIIEFGTTEIGGKQVYFVRDNGQGFDQADADKLFKPFQRLPGSEAFRGSGIGLATVERIIRRHCGKIWAEGEPEKGACFYFTLGPDCV